MHDQEGSDAFSGLMTALDPPLIVVTAAAGGVRAGCLVGFHTQSSIGPARYGIWLSKANRTYEVALTATHLGVHFLTDSAADLALAERFGTLTGDDVDKFAGLDVTTGTDDVPLLAACPNRLVVRRTALLDEGGDHVCAPGETVSVEFAGPFTPLRVSGAPHLVPGHASDERRAPAR